MDFKKITTALQKNGYIVKTFIDKEGASAYLDAHINKKTVGFGDSETITELGLFTLLKGHNEVIDPQNRKEGSPFSSTAILCLSTDIFILSVNAISETGELVNIDGLGNRIAGSLYGHEKVYFVIGKNKITKTLEKAIYRARNVAAPQNAKRLKIKTPCAIKGDKCYDCSSPERICNCLVIHYKKMLECEMEIILVNEELGL